MTIHPGMHPRPVSEGIPFLGFMVYPERRRLKRRKGIYFRRKLKDLMAAYQGGKIPLADITASVRGWVNHVRYGNTIGLRKAVLGQAVLKSRRCNTPQPWAKKRSAVILTADKMSALPARHCGLTHR